MPALERLTLITVGVCCLWLLTGCEVASDLMNPPHRMTEDKNGLKPLDVVSNFVEAARATNYVEAERYWFVNENRPWVPEKGTLLKFCKQFQDLKYYKLAKPARGKGCWIIDLYGETTSGETYRWPFGVVWWTNGEWRMPKSLEFQ